jgi:translation initiation factor IF-3
MNAFFEMVKENALIERPAKQEGRNMTMVLTPKAS